jgi:hypothetical protein
VAELFLFKVCSTSRFFLSCTIPAITASSSYCCWHSLYQWNSNSPPSLSFHSLTLWIAFVKATSANIICVSCCGFFKCYCLNLVINKRIQLVKNIVNKPNLRVQLKKHEIFRLDEIPYWIVHYPKDFSCLFYLFPINAFLMVFLSFWLSKDLRVA